MPGWAATILAALMALVGGTFAYVIAQDRRITRLEERVHGIGLQMREIPKRNTDHRSEETGK